MRPYREPGFVEADAAPAAASLGGARSRHVPPPLWSALLGPVLIAIVLFVVLRFVVDAPGAVSLIVAAAALGLLSWPPLRTYGQEVTLHDQGLVLSRRGAPAAIAFEDVNEVWFELPWRHSRSGAYLRALRLVLFDGKTHRVPLTLDGGAMLANAILRGCSTPLLLEARQALAAGETLTFGPIQLTRAGITVKGAYAAWSELRVARLDSEQVSLYRRFPILSWRNVALDRIPNPSIFWALVAQSVKVVRRDGWLLVELDSPGDAARARTSTREVRDLALRNMVIGGVIFFVGLAITWASYSANRGHHFVAIGPVVYGAILFVQGLMAFVSRR